MWVRLLMFPLCIPLASAEPFFICAAICGAKSLGALLTHAAAAKSAAAAAAKSTAAAAPHVAAVGPHVAPAAAATHATVPIMGGTAAAPAATSPAATVGAHAATAPGAATSSTGGVLGAMGLRHGINAAGALTGALVVASASVAPLN